MVMRMFGFILGKGADHSTILSSMKSLYVIQACSARFQRLNRENRRPSFAQFRKKKKSGGKYALKAHK